MLLFCGSSWVVISREEYVAPVPRKQAIWIFLGIGVLMLAIIGQNLWWPGLKEGGREWETWARNPAIIVPIWALMVSVMFVHWRRSRRTPVQN